MKVFKKYEGSTIGNHRLLFICKLWVNWNQPECVQLVSFPVVQLLPRPPSLLTSLASRIRANLCSAASHISLLFLAEALSSLKASSPRESKALRPLTRSKGLRRC